MSLVFNMVGGGSGGTLKDTDAVLFVTVPTGSTVTATKGGITLTPTMWVKAADATLDCAIFSIPSSQFDATIPWTITATNGTSTASDTVLITTNKEYEVTLSYGLYLYNAGDQCTDVTNGWSNAYQEGVTPTRTYNTDNIYMRGVGSSTAGSNGSIVTNQMIDVSNYNTLAIVLTQASIPNGTAERFGLTNNRTNRFSSYAISASTNDVGTITLDISSATGSFYVGFGGGGSVNLTWSFTLTQVYLE